MKAILNFNLDDPEDKQAHLRCVKASELCNVLWEMDQWLRGIIKFPPDDMGDDVYKAHEEVRDKLSDLMSNNGIYFDELFT